MLLVAAYFAVSLLLGPSIRALSVDVKTYWNYILYRTLQTHRGGNSPKGWGRRGTPYPCGFRGISPYFFPQGVGGAETLYPWGSYPFLFYYYIKYELVREYRYRCASSYRYMLVAEDSPVGLSDSFFMYFQNKYL